MQEIRKLGTCQSLPQESLLNVKIKEFSDKNASTTNARALLRIELRTNRIHQTHFWIQGRGRSMSPEPFWLHINIIISFLDRSRANNILNAPPPLKNHESVPAWAYLYLLNHIETALFTYSRTTYRNKYRNKYCSSQ